MHTRGAAEDVAAGVPFVGESFHPDDGFWLTRRLMFQRKMHEEKRRGDHYFHSTFVDNVLSGLVGLRVELDDAADITSARLVVHPLFAADQFAYVAATRVAVRGRDVVSRGTATARGTAGEKPQRVGRRPRRRALAGAAPPRGATALSGLKLRL